MALILIFQLSCIQKIQLMMCLHSDTGETMRETNILKHQKETRWQQQAMTICGLNRPNSTTQIFEVGQNTEFHIHKSTEVIYLT